MVLLLIPTLSIMAYLFFFQIAPIFVLIYRLLTVPFRIFRKQKKESPAVSLSPTNKDPIYLYLPFLISISLYVLAAWFLNGFYPNTHWLPTLGILGFIWGLILFFAVKKGLLGPEA